MRPPASDRLTVNSLPAHDVTSGISLKGFSDWRNLTTDESIQIASIDDLSLTEASFYHCNGNSNSLKFVEAIESPTRESVPSEEGVKVTTLEQELQDGYFTRTLVSLDKLATRSGRSLDSRLIFSPCAKGDNLRRTRVTRDSGTSYHLNNQRTSQHRKLWHSDSELFVPLDESLLVECTSVDSIYKTTNRLQGGCNKPVAESLSFVKPLETITHASKVSEIKPVPLLSACEDSANRTESQKIAMKCETEAVSVKSHAMVTNVCNAISKSIKKKGKTFTNIGRLNELFKSKDAKAAVPNSDKSRDDVSDRVPSVSKMTPRECLTFETDIQIGIQESSSTNESTFEKSANDLTDGLEKGRGSRRLPCLGVRRKESNTATIDKLDMGLVCDLKRMLASNARKVQIKTNGSLRLKSNNTTCATEIVWVCNPKRVGSRRFGTGSFRTNRTCIVSTV